jgi:hypothetical protein
MSTIPIGYRIEYRPADYCFYTLGDFRRETQRLGGRIHSLHESAQPNCPAEPVAYRGRFWCEAKHWKGNAAIDPHAVPVYLGPELHDPEKDAV